MPSTSPIHNITGALSDTRRKRCSLSRRASSASLASVMSMWAPTRRKARPCCIALDLGLDRDPAHLSVVRPDNAVFGIVVAHVAFDGVDELPLGPFAILWMDAPHPVLVRFGGSFRRQAVDLQILGRTAVAESRCSRNDLHAADLADLLDAREIGFAVAQGALDANLIVDVGVGADPARRPCRQRREWAWRVPGASDTCRPRCAAGT